MWYITVKTFQMKFTSVDLPEVLLIDKNIWSFVFCLQTIKKCWNNFKQECELYIKLLFLSTVLIPSHRSQDFGSGSKSTRRWWWNLAPQRGWTLRTSWGSTMTQSISYRTRVGLLAFTPGLLSFTPVHVESETHVTVMWTLICMWAHIHWAHTYTL